MVEGWGWGLRTVEAESEERLGLRGEGVEGNRSRGSLRLVESGGGSRRWG